MIKELFRIANSNDKRWWATFLLILILFGLAFIIILSLYVLFWPVGVAITLFGIFKLIRYVFPDEEDSQDAES